VREDQHQSIEKREEFNMAVDFVTRKNVKVVREVLEFLTADLPPDALAGRIAELSLAVSEKEEKENQMNAYAVVHLIHVGAPHQHIAKLFVTDVPDGVTKADVRDRLTEAGRGPGEFGIPWANHYVEKLVEADIQVKGAWNRGDVEKVAWGELKFSYE
jgi:hypothetical protein